MVRGRGARRPVVDALIGRRIVERPVAAVGWRSFERGPHLLFEESGGRASNSEVALKSWVSGIALMRPPLEHQAAAVLLGKLAWYQKNQSPSSVHRRRE